jgi:hypothetical protein
MEESRVSRRRDNEAGSPSSAGRGNFNLYICLFGPIAIDPEDFSGDAACRFVPPLLVPHTFNLG